ncbi:DUF58 domain-containing protein [Hoeflea sp.]|uniref:DUF58 domain-containing protein n=1 Tax=Hoeflea sp. TaxID=1940281 RepID=UPI00374A9622
MSDLIAVRPDRKITGFAPGGRVSTHQFGNNRSVYQGRGMEFDEARVYQPGDDVRAIDWRVTARTGEVHTKLYHEERERPVYILLDQRSMMHFGTRVRFKSVLAARIAAMLCWVGVDGGDRVGGLLLTQSGLADFPATRTRQGMLGFLNAISKATRTLDTGGSPETTLRYAVRRLRHMARPGTLVFIISDFSDFDTDAEQEINRLSLHAHVTNILTTDHLDAHLPARGNYNVTDGHGVVALAEVGRAHLRDHEAAFNDRRLRLETMSRRRAMAFLDLKTSDDPASVLRPHRKQSQPGDTRGAAA